MTTDFHPCEARVTGLACGQPATASLGFECSNCGPIINHTCEPHALKLAAIFSKRPDQRRDHTSDGCGGHSTVKFMEAVYLDDAPVPSGYADMLRSL